MTATTRLIWRVLVRDIERRDAWGDRIVDALRDPTDSFVLAD